MTPFQRGDSSLSTNGPLHIIRVCPCSDAKRQDAKRQTETPCRRVRFGLEGENGVAATWYESTLDLTDADVQNMWWMSEDFDRAKSAQRQWAKEFKTENEDFVKSYLELYKSCATLSISQVLRTKTAKQILCNNYNIRGLEFRLSKAMSAHRSLYISALLDGTDTCEDLICARLTKISKLSKTMARLLALSDAKQAD